MTAIQRIEIHEFTFDVENMAGDRAYSPGAKLTIGSFGLRILTDDGLVGEYCPVHGGKKAILAQVLAVAPLLLGRDPFRREQLYDDMKRALRQHGFLGVGAMDIALWDIAGKAAGMSVSRMLGGYRTRLPAYPSTNHADRAGGLDCPEAFADFAERCHGLGYKAFKIHGWNDGDAKEEARNLLHVAKVVGDRMDLMIDPACELRTFADALYVGRACDDAGFFWYEDPMRDAATSQHLHRKLRQMIRTPLLIGEHVRGVEAKADWIAAEATDFMRADPDLDLGITGTMKIAHLAESFGLDLEIHAPGPAHRACMSAIRNSNYYELALVGPKIRNPCPPVHSCGYSDQLEDCDADGCFPVPDGPGLGVTYDWDYIEKHRTALHRFG
jgi:L-alanine-DL-glutamate epimerase-like enolase superfamily enzyme